MSDPPLPPRPVSPDDTVLRERDLLGAVLGSLPGIYYMYHESGRFVRWNRLFETVSGYTADDVARMHPLEFFAPEERTLVAERIATVFRDGWCEVEADLLCKSGRRIPYLFNGARAEIAGEPYLLGMGIDVTSHRNALAARQAADEVLQARQATLEQSEALLRVGSRMARMGAWVVDLANMKVIWSEELLALLDLPPGHSPDFEYGIRIYLPEYRERVREGFAACATQGTPFDLEVQAVTATGRVIWVRVMGEAAPESDGSITRVRGAFQDIGERRRLEEQLRQVQKMEAVGQLAGGIAHDFNNLLTVINGCSEVALAQAGNDQQLRSLLGEIREAGARAGTLTRQLMTFSRQQVLDPQLLDLNEVVRGMESMLRRLIGEHVDLTIACMSEPGNIRADRGQVEQVLMNLVVNARDAMPQGGRLDVETRLAELDAVFCRGSEELQPGTYVCLTVTDTGTGMDAATRTRIFEPFFTTRGPGHGTGLGLATVHGIMRQARGHIAVTSEVGRGSTFDVYFPRVEGARTPAPRLPARPEIPTGTETILVAEDEDAVRSLTARVLRKCGYQVLEAANGKAAIELLATDDRHIDLLVTDVVMPYIGGPELAERLLASRPDCKVLFVSGYADGAVIRHGVIQGGHGFLQKPFSVPALAQKVRATLDG